MNYTNPHVSQDVYNYNRKKLCNLYDSSQQSHGQAYDIVYTNEINGWKSISFNIPFVINKKRNFRWNYIRNEYLLRMKKDDETDWFIIHSPKKNKNRKAISNAVTCSHLSSILKTKNLYMTFDDENGIGTLPYLIEQALKATGWTLGSCDTFYERDGVTEKVRSLHSEGKAGAYQLITNICNLFNAYPVFDGDKKTVSIYSQNNKGNLYEMTMGKDIESLSVSYDSDDIITRLYVEGEYSDNGYVGIDDVNPTGLSYLLNFDYYKEIGLFTDEHQEALDLYYSEMKSAIDIIRSVAGEINTKENSLNDLWGQINYVFYPISNGAITKKIIGGTVTENQLEITEGNEIVVIPSSKEYRVVTAGANGSIDLTTDDLYAIKFITKPSARIGAKEVAVEAKEKLIQNLKDRITSTTSDDKKADINAQITKQEQEIRDLYVGTELETGLYDLMTSAAVLVIELNNLSSQREEALTKQENVEVDFAIAMGDLLKDGYWNNSNYVVGQEAFQYEDAIDVINQMSKPDVSYSVSRVSMSGILGHPITPLDLNAKIRVYDPDLGVNDFAYISGITQYQDKPENDMVDVSTEDIVLSGLTLDSILSRITKLADLIDQKNSLYDRAEAIGSDGSIYMDRLEGQINVQKNQLSSSTSNWYTDENGNLVFESTTGKSAMMLCGEGFMIAYGRTTSGDWNWRTFGTGEGFTADAIVTGYQSADRIETRSITVNKLAADVGQSLDLSSNKSIRLAVETTMTNKLSASFISVTLNKNSSSTQIFDPNTNTYMPDWSRSALIVTPSVLVGGLPVSNNYDGLSFEWTRREGNGNDTELVSGESVTNGSLSVSKNLLAAATGNSITYSCLVTYTNEYGAVSEKAEISFAMVESGSNGNGIASIVNYYLKSSASSGVTTKTSGWTTAVQATTATHRYLWNYEVITYTDNTTFTSVPCIIGTHGATGTAGSNGTNGKDGVGISSVTEYYARSKSNSTAPTSWSTVPPTLTSEYKYLWNYEKFTMTDNSAKETSKRVIGVYGDTGNNGKDGVNSVSFSVYAPNGSVFTEDITSLSIVAVGYCGGSDITSLGTLSWEINDGTSWEALESTGSTQAISSSDVYSIGSYRCILTYQGISYIDTITITDETDIIIKSNVEPKNPVLNMLWLDISDQYKNILKRWNGTEWIETTLSQEEITNLYSTLAEYNSEIEQLGQSITLRVTQEEMKSELENKADADWVTQRLESIIKQTADDITFQFNQAKEFTVESTSEFQNFIAEVQSYQRFSKDGQELGMLNSPFIAKLGNTKLSFLQDGAEIAYISNNKLYITEAQVTSKLSIGTDEYGYFDWITTSTGLGLKWKG